MKILFITTIGLLYLWIDSGHCMSCYQCDSNTDSDCSERFDHDNLDTMTVRSVDCSVDAAKFCIKTTGVWGGVVGTTRFCSSRDMGNQCQFIRYPDHDRVYRACIYTCRGNHCNEAVHSRATPVLILLMATLASSFLLGSRS